MKRAYILYNIAKADFLQRARDYSFLITLGFAVFAAYNFVPPVGASYVTVDFQNHRGVYNSAWIGSSVALLTIVFLGLFGFYLVKDTIKRDYTTKVGQIIAATPVSSTLYTLGKMISNFVLLTSIVIATAITAGIMQFVRGESGQIELWKLLSPFLLIVLPSMLVVAALAVLFEAIPGLRGSFGNIVYFFIYGLAAMLPVQVLSKLQSDSFLMLGDVFGLAIPIRSISATLKGVFPEYNGMVTIGIRAAKGLQEIFTWEGIAWTLKFVLQRLFWLAGAVLIAMAAKVFFRRFDPSYEKVKREKVKVKVKNKDKEPELEASARRKNVSTLPPVKVEFDFWSMVMLELRLGTKGLSIWWLATVGGLMLGQLFAPIEVVRSWLLPAAWFFSVAIWSKLGTREIQNNTWQIVFSGHKAIDRQMLACWTSGLLVAIITGGIAAIRLLIAGEWIGMWLTGILFIPTLALALGVLSNGSKLFEVIFTLWLYAGPMNKAKFLDFIGTSKVSASMDASLIYIVLTVILFGIALTKRRIQAANLKV